MAGGDKDHVKTRFPATEQTLLPNLKILISVVVIKHLANMRRRYG